MPSRVRPAVQPALPAWAPGLMALLLAACASSPEPARSGRDGPGERSAAELADLPDAVPRVERLRVGGPNKPYTVLGQSYTPETEDVPLVERGLASWYGRKFHGLPTASGEIFDMHAMSAAHRTMPLPSYARVRNPRNGREIIVRVNDRGPFHPDRIIDLSYAAAVKLGVQRGVALVEVERLTHEVIRSGSWRRDATPPAEPPTLSAAAAPPPERLQGLPAEPAPEPAAPAPPSRPAEAALAVEASPGSALRLWLQFGAFRERAGAEGFSQQLQSLLLELAAPLVIRSADGWHRVLAGPYPSRELALRDQRGSAGRLSSPPRLVERP